MKVPNMDDVVKTYLGEDPPLRKNSWWMPKNPFRMIVCGATGYGKTNLMLFMLLRCMKYDRLTLCAKMATEPKYEFLKQFFEELKAEGVMEDAFQWYDKLEDLPPYEQYPDRDGTTRVLIFDDMVNERDQQKIEDYFIMGRKKDISIFYLAQRYTEVPKMVRQNADNFITFDQRPKEVPIIYQDLVSGDLSLPEFRKMFKEATKTRHDTLMIQRNPEVPELRYRKNLTEYFVRDSM